MDKHIIKIEDLSGFQNIAVVAKDLESKKKIIIETYVRKVSPGRHEFVNVIEVWKLDKLITSTSHLNLAMVAYNKI